MSYFHFKKSAEEERQAMTTSVFKISRGDGGCLNPPCRQQSNALQAFFPRVPALCTQPMLITRPEDGFMNGLIANRSHAKRDRGLQQHMDDSGFVFLITSEESLMGEIKGKRQNSPLRRALHGFGGV
ncbi:hypothetical protein [Methylophilus sp. TWE2]|uniref:hypothetical protein n=1 Tax=Methylophilus sp. TWE2 TaxID=1662285 RepID=UPI000670F6D9|nr:hypothetical protein [Methylophilus sp. TWE2]AKR43313.1 hypothetical protein ACJ67_07650 [Methylophilus sp. TWE2]